jgi:hypothetical protein
MTKMKIRDLQHANLFQGSVLDITEVGMGRFLPILGGADCFETFNEFRQGS